MRKTILLLLSFISLVFNLYANQGFINNPLKDNTVSFKNQYKEWKSKFNFESLTNPLDISGRVDPYANIQIVIIESTEENNFQGIPFDIMGDDVTNSAKAGRRIGDFTIFSNSPKVTLTVDVGPLESGNFVVDYELIFNYRYSYYDENNNEIDVTKEDSFFSNEVAGQLVLESTNPTSKINFKSGSIRAKVLLNNAINAAPGPYTSTVQITMGAE